VARLLRGGGDLLQLRRGCREAGAGGLVLARDRAQLLPGLDRPEPGVGGVALLVEAELGHARVAPLGPHRLNRSERRRGGKTGVGGARVVGGELRLLEDHVVVGRRDRPLRRRRAEGVGLRLDRRTPRRRRGRGAAGVGRQLAGERVDQRGGLRARGERALAVERREPDAGALALLPLDLVDEPLNEGWGDVHGRS
jgi:hypothetical protein